MTKETEAIFSSTGRLGVSRRQYGRLYANGYYCADPIQVEQNFRKLVAIGERYQQRISRSVLRGLVSGAVMQHISHNSLQRYLEVAVPLTEFTNDDSWLIYLASNQPGRDLIVSREVMTVETNVQKRRIASPLERVRLMTEQGYSFASQIQAGQVDQVYALWGDTFGWNNQEVDSLRKRLEVNQHKDPSQRDIWFAAIGYNGTIISLAMAERLAMPAAYGQLDLIESTEWRTRNEYVGRGFMTATLAVLTAQILSDFQDNPNGLPVIFAECNFQSRSDRVGHGAGFRIPECADASQILVQNVLVRDGQPIEDGRLRDFTFMYLPVEAMCNHYNPTQTEAIKRLVV